jgi:hypothetical protein
MAPDTNGEIQVFKLIFNIRDQAIHQLRVSYETLSCIVGVQMSTGDPVSFIIKDVPEVAPNVSQLELLCGQSIPDLELTFVDANGFPCILEKPALLVAAVEPKSITFRFKAKKDAPGVIQASTMSKLGSPIKCVVTVRYRVCNWIPLRIVS